MFYIFKNLWSMFTVNHKDIAMLYVIISLFSALMAMSFSIIMRTELSSKTSLLGNNQVYNCVLTSHGLIMVFLLVMPFFMGALSNLLIPIFSQVPDMTYPRLNILSFWLLTPGLVLMIVSFTTESASATGWTLYPPLSSKTAHPGHSMDSLILMVHVLACSSIMGSINFISTVMMYKSTEESDIHVFVWAVLTSSVLLILSLPVLGGGVTLLLFERNFNSSYFDMNSADVVLFQHLFWFFGHPEVYVLILPGFGIISLCVTYMMGGEDVFSKTTMVYCMLSITLMGCVVYGHHQYTVALDLDTRQYFSSSTMIISIPTGIKVLSWMMGMFLGKIYMQPTLYWVLGFISLFTMGGVTAIILSNTSIDIVLHDTYFTTSHFHQVLSLGSVFAIFCSMSLLYPNLYAWMYLNMWMNASFWLIFIAVNFTFIPQYILGSNALPRKYPESSVYFNWLNFLSTSGSNLSLIALLLYLFMLLEGMLSMRCFKQTNSQKLDDSWALSPGFSMKHSILEHTYTSL